MWLPQFQASIQASISSKGIWQDGQEGLARNLHITNRYSAHTRAGTFTSERWACNTAPSITRHHTEPSTKNFRHSVASSARPQGSYLGSSASDMCSNDSVRHTRRAPDSSSTGDGKPLHIGCTFSGRYSALEDLADPIPRCRPDPIARRNERPTSATQPTA